MIQNNLLFITSSNLPSVDFVMGELQTALATETHWSQPGVRVPAVHCVTGEGGEEGVTWVGEVVGLEGACHTLQGSEEY